MKKPRKSQKRVRSPREAETFDQVRELPRDNVSIGSHWMLYDGYEVTIALQRRGEGAQAMVSMPRWKFDRFSRWWQTGEWGRPKKPVRRK